MRSSSISLGKARFRPLVSAKTYTNIDKQNLKVDTSFHDNVQNLRLNERAKLPIFFQHSLFDFRLCNV